MPPAAVATAGGAGLVTTVDDLAADVAEVGAEGCATEVPGRREGESGVADVPGGRLGGELAPTRLSRPLSVGVPPADAWRILPLSQDTCSGVNTGAPPVAI